MRESRFSLDAFIRILICAGFSLLFLYLWASGRVYNFVHSRVALFVLIASLVFLMLAVVQLSEILRCKYSQAGRLRYGVYLFFLLPLLLGFAFSGNSLNLDYVSGRGGQLHTPAGMEPGSNSEQLTEPEQRVIIDENNYASQLILIYRDPASYLGREVDIAGFVYRDDYMSDGQFAVARYLITCCAADAQVVGLVCSYDKTVSVSDWVRVIGVVELERRDGKDLPVISVQYMEPVDPPANPYVYY